MPHPVKTKRVYEAPEPQDGYRVLVDRLWPRGIKKEDLQYDRWMKEIAPSTDLRKWFHQHPDSWDRFVELYQAELSHPERRQLLDELRQISDRQPVTLLYASRDTSHNHANFIAAMLA